MAMLPNTDAPRVRCPACFKQFSSKQILIQHLEKVGHSRHEPQCGSCHKHCFCLESLREHLLGRLAKKECAIEFANRGCNLCLTFLESKDKLTEHRVKCQYVSPLQSEKVLTANGDISSERLNDAKQPGAIALDCEMVGGGRDGSANICARVCIVDEHENVLLNTYVQPILPITDFRHEITGIKAADLRDAPSFRQVRRTVLNIFGNQQQLLVGHDLRHDLACLRVDYPPELLRDTATYQLLVKTSGVSHKLRFLTETYLGYKIQDGTIHDPREDAVAAMRLYRRMRSFKHSGAVSQSPDLFGLTLQDLDATEISCSSAYSYTKSTFYCWCLDCN